METKLNFIETFKCESSTVNSLLHLMKKGAGGSQSGDLLPA